MFGLDLHVWEEIMVWSLAIAAIAALGVVVSTRVVTILQRDALRESGVRIAEAAESAAKANAQAAEIAKANIELQTKLEQERIERLRLEETVSPRRIKPEEKVSLIAEFRRFSGQTVSVVSYTMDAESVSLGLEVIESLKSAGVVVLEGLLTQQPMSGIAVGIHTVGKDRALAHGLARAFGDKTPLTATYNPESIPGFEVRAVLGGFDDSKAAATILIGPKPIPKAR